MVVDAAKDLGRPIARLAEIGEERLELGGLHAAQVGVGDGHRPIIQWHLGAENARLALVQRLGDAGLADPPRRPQQHQARDLDVGLARRELDALELERGRIERSLERGDVAREVVARRSRSSRADSSRARRAPVLFSSEARPAPRSVERARVTLVTLAAAAEQRAGDGGSDRFAVSSWARPTCDCSRRPVPDHGEPSPRARRSWERSGPQLLDLAVASLAREVGQAGAKSTSLSRGRLVPTAAFFHSTNRWSR